MPAIIRINLETGSVSRREQEKDDLLLGGRRLTGSIIAAEVPPECEPLSGRNKLVLACGGLAGRVSFPLQPIVHRRESPLTGGISLPGGMTRLPDGRTSIGPLCLKDGRARPTGR